MSSQISRYTPPHTDSASNETLDRLRQQGAIWNGALHDSACQGTHPFSEPSARTSRVIPFGAPAIDSKLPSGGLATGAVHEIIYNDPLLPQALASTLPAVLAYSAHSQLQHNLSQSGWSATSSTKNRVPLNTTTHHHAAHSAHTQTAVWIGKRCWPSPFLLNALDTPDTAPTHRLLSRSLFIDPPNNASTLWAIETCLRSRAVHLVIAACPRVSRTTTQRLAYVARTNNTTALLLRAAADITAPTYATSRWCITPAPSLQDAAKWELRLLKLTGIPHQQLAWIVELPSREHALLYTTPLGAELLCAQQISPVSPQASRNNSVTTSVATGTA
jgi:hypothetical protein